MPASGKKAFVMGREQWMMMLLSAPMWCMVVKRANHFRAAMQNAPHVHDDKSAHRLSVSLTAEQHRELNEIARKNRVSVAWVVREAVDRLLKEDMPLLHMGKE